MWTGRILKVAKYALTLINKHIEAEGGPDKIDVELVVHGPALELFEKDRMDAEMTKRFDQLMEKGVKAEMCQVSM
ncbi:MAG TPA: DsrE family protein, partial [Nitrospiraceae bacterium]|nr:DsrE family protein [Nitrospiraceae bacterium]